MFRFGASQPYCRLCDRRPISNADDDIYQYLTKNQTKAAIASALSNADHAVEQEYRSKSKVCCR
jgi:hypothetical protein